MKKVRMRKIATKLTLSTKKLDLSKHNISSFLRETALPLTSRSNHSEVHSFATKWHFKLFLTLKSGKFPISPKFRLWVSIFLQHTILIFLFISRVLIPRYLGEVLTKLAYPQKWHIFILKIMEIGLSLMLVVRRNAKFGVVEENLRKRICHWSFFTFKNWSSLGVPLFVF